MKLAKLANELKTQLSDLTAAAKQVGITQPKADSEVSEQQIAQIKSLLDGTALPASEEPVGIYQGLILDLVGKVVEERLLMAQMRPQIQRMLTNSVAQFAQTRTLPPNPALQKWVTALAQVETPAIQINYDNLDELPYLDLEAWANDPAGALPPSTELLLTEGVSQS